MIGKYGSTFALSLLIVHGIHANFLHTAFEPITDSCQASFILPVYSEDGVYYTILGRRTGRGVDSAYYSPFGGKVVNTDLDAAYTAARAFKRETNSSYSVEDIRSSIIINTNYTFHNFAQQYVGHITQFSRFSVLSFYRQFLKGDNSSSAATLQEMDDVMIVRWDDLGRAILGKTLRAKTTIKGHSLRHGYIEAPLDYGTVYHLLHVVFESKFYF